MFTMLVELSSCWTNNWDSDYIKPTKTYRPLSHLILLYTWSGSLCPVHRHRYWGSASCTACRSAQSEPWSCSQNKGQCSYGGCHKSRQYFRSWYCRSRCTNEPTKMISTGSFNSLAPGRCVSDFRIIVHTHFTNWYLETDILISMAYTIT